MQTPPLPQYEEKERSYSAASLSSDIAFYWSTLSSGQQIDQGSLHSCASFRTSMIAENHSHSPSVHPKTLINISYIPVIHLEGPTSIDLGPFRVDADRQPKSGSTYPRCGAMRWMIADDPGCRYGPMLARTLARQWKRGEIRWTLRSMC